MRHGMLLLAGVVGLSLGTALAQAVAREGESLAPPDGSGLQCVGDGAAASPAIALDAGRPDTRIPNCPVNFSNCVDVPGRKCTLQDCVTVDLGYDKCKKNGHVFQCTNGNLQQTTCTCRERLHLICCDDDTCGFPCGECSGGSLTTVCP
ncbi:MAG TPA: hypothetical protein VJS92_02980 [Candidatus Polarisedimenticolaceae bacterium]|nr:hypothetical protein [Candidatus Polarisedimenticolaceae bacterium]